jgi:L-amino acid N-acyltransferase YncA
MFDGLPTVRPARPDDLLRIQEIYAHFVTTSTASFELTPPSVEEMRGRFEAITGKGFPFLVAELDGRVAGFAYANTYRPRAAYDYTVEDSVYIAHDMLGRGIGRSLLGALVEICAEAGHRQMVAVIGDSGNEASISFHTALGFTRVGLLPSVGFKHGRWVDSVLMQRALGPGDATPPSRKS